MPADGDRGLDRFLLAQDSVYGKALTEIRNGRKESHWMWFIFPQFEGLGRSPTSQRFAIASLVEARAYLAHPILGKRLRECAEALVALHGRSAREIFGSPDDAKLRSSATLFALVSAPDSVFDRLLEKYFCGEPDERTLALACHRGGDQEP